MVEDENVDVIRILLNLSKTHILKKAADVNLYHDKWVAPSALLSACCHYGVGDKENNFEMVKMLIQEAKANVNIVGKDFDTPLTRSAHGGHSIAITKLLLDAGADPNLYEKERRHVTYSPLFEAAEGGHLETMELLMAAKANTTLFDKVISFDNMKILEKFARNCKYGVKNKKCRGGSQSKVKVAIKVELLPVNSSDFDIAESQAQSDSNDSDASSDSTSESETSSDSD